MISNPTITRDVLQVISKVLCFVFINQLAIDLFELFPRKEGYEYVTPILGVLTLVTVLALWLHIKLVRIP